MFNLNSFYQKFVLRDLLSFVTPGAIFSLSLWFAFNEKLPLDRLDFPSSIVFIVLFGIFYVVGFAFQAIGVQMEFFRIHGQRNYEEHLRRLRDFYSHVSQQNNQTYQDSLLAQHERFVILKQLCGNNALSMKVSSFVYLILFFSIPPKNIYLIVFAVIFIMGMGLLYYHEDHLEQQEIWEDLNASTIQEETN